MQSLGLNNQLRPLPPGYGNLSEALKLLDEEINFLKGSNLTIPERILENLKKVKQILESIIENNELGGQASILLSANLFGSQNLSAKLSEAEEGLKRTKEDLAKTKEDLERTKTESREELDRTNKKLARTEKLLEQTKQQLQKTQDELRATRLEAAEKDQKFKALEEDNLKLKEKIETFHDKLLETEIKVATLMSKNAKDTDTQTLGDFAFQIQKVLGMLFGKDVKMTGNQLKHFYKNKLDEESKKRFKLLGLSNKTQIIDLANAIESLKEMRFESAHQAIEKQIKCSPSILRNLAIKHNVHETIKPLIDFWNNAVKAGEIFNEDSWELKDELFS